MIWGDLKAPHIKKFARNPFFSPILAGFPVGRYRRHHWEKTIGTIMEISHPECLTSNLINWHAPGWDSHSAWRNLLPLASPCARLAFTCFTHQTINAVKGINKSVDEIFSPLLEILARLIRPSRGNRSSFRNPHYWEMLVILTTAGCGTTTIWSANANPFIWSLHVITCRERDLNWMTQGQFSNLASLVRRGLQCGFLNVNRTFLRLSFALKESLHFHFNGARLP
jgi:hypothetical protein